MAEELLEFSPVSEDAQAGFESRICAYTPLEHSDWNGWTAICGKNLY